MVTRDDVAREAGVSSAVVSYVVNNGPRKVAEATRQRVLQVIEELGYRPNRLAGALRGRSSKVLGLLLPSLDDPFSAAVAQAVEDAAHGQGYALLVATSDGDAAVELAHAHRFLEQQVGGAIAAGAGSADAVDTLREAGVPVVALEHDGVGATASVRIDARRGGALAVQHLATHGHEAIACLAGRGRAAQARERGFLEAMARRHLDVPEAWLLHEATTLDGGFIAGKTLLELDPMPSALLVTSDAQAVGLLKAVLAAGLRVPRDLAIVGFDGLLIGGFTVPGLTSVSAPALRLAERGVERLTAIIEGRRLDGADLDVIAPFLTVRGSCGCPERT